MNDKPASTGGFIVIADYTTSHRFILVALVNSKEGYTESELDIIKISQLNIEQLGMAGFVNINNYQNEDTAYRPLSFMRGNKDVAGYFASFLGAETNVESSSHMTGIFIKALKEYFIEKEYNLNTKEQLNQAVFSFCEEKRKNKEPVNIAAISSILNPDNTDEFFEFTQNPNKNYNLNTIIELIDKRQLDKLTSFSYKGDGFKISFDKELYNERKIVLDGNNNLIMKDLQPEFIARLKQEFENND